jgi:archaetidylinositol phosphate synthase
MLNSLRPYLTKFLEPLASRLNINPNIVTIISPFIAIISAIFFASGNLIGGALFILLSGFLDVVDGAVARYHDRASPFGAFLDSTMDRFADAFIFIGIIYGGYCDWLVGVLAIHSAITVSYVRARAESQGVECNIGIAERAVRMIILMFGAVLAVIFHSNIIFTYFIYILVILSYITVGQRILHVWKALNGPRAPKQRRLN